MKTRFGRIAAIAGATIVVLLAAIVWWLFYDNPARRADVPPIDLAAIRAEAARLPGSGPVRIEVETVSHSRVPRIAMVAGTGWGKIDVVRNAYRLVFAPGASAGPIVVDTTFDEKTARNGPLDSYDRAAFQRVLAAMDGAAAIVVTHEHNDHIGGLLVAPHLAAILPRALLTPEQFDIKAPIAPLSWPNGVREGYRPLVYDRFHAIAPGVVLIRTPGHTPGSQMIYVRRADGHEFLLIGDTASEADNIRLQRIRSRFVTDFYSHDDRQAVMRQTQALHALAAANPALALVPGHDGEATLALERAGLLTRGFGGR